MHITSARHRLPGLERINLKSLLQAREEKERGEPERRARREAPEEREKDRETYSHSRFVGLCTCVSVSVFKKLYSGNDWPVVFQSNFLKYGSIL